MRTGNLFISFSAVLLLFCFTKADAQSTIGFESQVDRTTNFLENGINWSLNIGLIHPAYSHSGSNAFDILGSGAALQADHKINVTSLWAYVNDERSGNHILSFEGQNLGTTNFSEYGTNWTLGGRVWTYGHTGSSSAYIFPSDKIQANHAINVTSLWIGIMDYYNATTWLTINCYNSSGEFVAAKQIISFNRNGGYQQINFTGFSSITQIEFVCNGSPSIYVDDISYSEVAPPAYIFNCYSSAGQFVATKQIHGSNVYQQVNFNNFMSVAKIEFIYNEQPLIYFIDDITYTDAGLLPVELTSFTAETAEKSVELKWKTATEVNNYGFEVERRAVSDRHLAWTKIGFVEGNGTTNAPKSYSFTDKSANGKISYRLKQIDRDGKFEYSQTVEVTAATAPKEFALEQNYPNPFNPTTVISYQLSANGFTSLKIYDAIGREVATLVNEVKEAGYYSAQFDGARLSSGIYFAKLSSSGKTQMRKLVLMK